MEDGGKNNRAPFSLSLSLSPDVNCAARRYNKNLLKLSCTYRGREEEEEEKGEAGKSANK